MRLSSTQKVLTNVRSYATPHLLNAIRFDISNANKEYNSALQLTMESGPIAVLLMPHVIAMFDIQALKEMFAELRRRRMLAVIPADAIRNNNRTLRTAAMYLAFRNGIKHFLPHGWETI